MKHSFVIGVTGPSGAGKTTALGVLAELGATVYDCDALYHELLQSDAALLARIEAAFPGTVRDGALDRAALAARVFGDPAALRRLNRITHPTVRRALKRRLRQERPRVAAIDAIGLFEGGLAPLCDVTVAVLAPEEARLARLTRRDGLTEEAARARMAAQRSAAEFETLCDLALRNDGTQAEFEAQCRETFKKIYYSFAIDI